MIDVTIPKPDIAHLVDLTSRGKSDNWKQEFMRLDFDKPNGAIYITFIKNHKSDSNPAFLNNIKSFIGKIFPILSEIDSLLKEKKQITEKSFLYHLASLFFRTGHSAYIDREIVKQIKFINKIIRIHSRHGLVLEVEYVFLPAS